MTNPSDMSNSALAEALERDCSYGLDNPIPHLHEAAYRLRAMEWQPIETADHERARETPIDVWVTFGDGFRCTDARFWGLGSNGALIYVGTDNKLIIPSHWMPKPSGPAPKGE